MRVFYREGFMRLPPNTIYSKLVDGHEEGYMYGLFCKGPKKFEDNDFETLDLLAEISESQNILKNSFRDFETDLSSFEKDEALDDMEKFIVWDTNDIIKLRNFLNEVI